MDSYVNGRGSTGMRSIDIDPITRSVWFRDRLRVISLFLLRCIVYVVVAVCCCRVVVIGGESLRRGGRLAFAPPRTRPAHTTGMFVLLSRHMTTTIMLSAMQ